MIKQLWIILLLKWQDAIGRTCLEWMWRSWFWIRWYYQRTHWKQPHREKTSTDILNKARFHAKELRDICSRRRHASKNRDWTNKGQRLKMMLELPHLMGVTATRPGELQSISNIKQIWLIGLIKVVLFCTGNEMKHLIWYPMLYFVQLTHNNTPKTFTPFRTSKTLIIHKFYVTSLV